MWLMKISVFNHGACVYNGMRDVSGDVWHMNTKSRT